MGLFSFLTRTKSVDTGPFAFLLGFGGPAAKSREYLKSYTSWVYACTSAIADEVATIGLRLQKKSGDSWEDVQAHPALELLTRVNPAMSSDDLFLSTQSYLELEGNAFWYVVGNGKGLPSEIWPLNPTQVEVKPGANFLIDGYVYTNNAGKQVPFKPEEIIHFKRFNPLSQYRGVGTIAAAALAIDSDTYAAEWNRNFFNNSALPAAVLQTDGKLSDEQFARIKASWESKYKGVANAHRTAVLEGGLKVEKLNISQKDMDFLEQRRFTRDEIMAMFRVPKPVLGITEDVNRANAEATDYVFAKRVVSPRMRFITTTLTEFYLPLFGLSTSEYRLWHSDPVPQNKESDLAYKKLALETGLRTRNELREEQGLKGLPDGDILLVPGTLKPIDLILNPPLPPANPTGVNPPPKKTVEKEAAADKVAGRVKFVISEIKKRTKDYKRLLTEQRAQLVGKLADDAGTKAFAVLKEDTSPERANELVRFLFSDWNDWIGLLLEPTRDTLTASYDEAGRQAVAQLDIDLTFDLRHARAISWLETNALNHATSIADTVRSEITHRIIHGVEEGLGADDIAASIGEFFDTQSQWRALRIARTEVISAYAEGSMEGYRQAGIVKTKRWITAGDARVDPECQMNEEQGSIALNLNFTTGHDAPPVHANCRCTIASGD
jgi:HK97 family phage portal protein